MRKQKRNSTEQSQGTTTSQAPTLAPTWQQIYRCARDIYFARGGREGITTKDWLQAEKEVKWDSNEERLTTNRHEA
jgi:hypothetical protein